jgi:diguanylate cyclase (GGDEF)-like protein
LAAFSATTASAVLSGLIVAAVIAINIGHLERGQLPKVIGVGAVAAIVNTSMTLVAVIALCADRRAIWLLVIVGLVLVLVYRAYASLASRHASLELLYGFTKAVGRSSRAEDVISAVLSQARDVLQAEHAELVLLPVAGEDAAHIVTVGPGDETRTRSEYAFFALDEAVSRYPRTRGPVVVPRSTRDPELRAYLTQREFDDCIILPLHGDAGVIGMITVANRLGNVRTFDVEDGRLAETIANHASVAVQNGRLMDRLRFEALHDALTGLPNRTLFHTRVREAIREARPARGQVAVMLMDLDRFKEVNDSLGHHNGDLLLQDVAARMKNSLGEGVTVARLGGDEFGIVLPMVGDVAGALAVAARMQAVLDQPFRHQELSLEVGATIGVSLYPDHGDDATTLLQRADVAMYAAKASSAGLEVYASELDQYSPRRLALVGELRRAIEGGGLEVYYQPKASCRTGDVIGVEALVRWSHPEYGFLPPDDFIPLAEHTGLIAPLTTHVLKVALRQCRAWHDAGFPISVAVNLSARSLLDANLAEEITTLLQEARLDPGWLMLEITESSVMSDPTRTIGVLNRLSAMGVKLSVDDFGTGYSSLSYLKRLPVDEVKVDKSFVLTMSSNDSDAAIVRSIVDLGRNLGLHVLAEGVEDERTWDLLCGLGCDAAQGYYLSRPKPASDITAWLNARIPEPAR